MRPRGGPLPDRGGGGGRKGPCKGCAGAGRGGQRRKARTGSDRVGNCDYILYIYIYIYIIYIIRQGRTGSETGPVRAPAQKPAPPRQGREAGPAGFPAVPGPEGRGVAGRGGLWAALCGSLPARRRGLVRDKRRGSSRIWKRCGTLATEWLAACLVFVESLNSDSRAGPWPGEGASSPEAAARPCSGPVPCHTRGCWS